MKADALPLSKLYDNLNKAYVIPCYQRPFAWDAEKVINLVTSIFDDAKTDSKLTSIGTCLFCEVINTGGKNPYGNNAPHSDAPNTVWEVVDGQQRLTALALVGFALRERMKTLAATGLEYSPPLELDQLFRTSRKMNGKTVPVLIRDEDNFDSGLKSDLARLLNYFAGNEPKPAIGVKLSRALDEVHSWVNENLDADSFPTFCSYFLSQCQFVQVVADDQDTAFSMFEPLNSTSAPLTAFEVFRSKVTRTLQPEPPSFPETYKLLDYDNALRDDVIKRSNELIFGTAQAYSGKRPKIHLVGLKQYLDGQATLDFVKRLEEGATFFNHVWRAQDFKAAWFDEETKNCIRFLKAAHHEAPLPILIRYFYTNPDRLSEVAKAIVGFFALWRAAFPTNKLPEVYAEPAHGRCS